jgi:ribonuclease HII
MRYFRTAQKLPFIKYIIGIDEVGRGPLAGPITVGSVMVRNDFPRDFFDGARDSKRLSALGRALWFEKIKAARRDTVLDYRVSFVSPKLVDDYGIARVTRIAIRRSLRKLDARPEEVFVLLDGGMRAPDEYSYQRTVIGGDEKEPLIGLASIVAKVLRDRRMEHLALEYPNFDFHIHKGYGTKRHISLLKKYGPCEIHRRSFLEGIAG